MTQICSERTVGIMYFETQLKSAMHSILVCAPLMMTVLSLAIAVVSFTMHVLDEQRLNTIEKYALKC